MHTVIETDIFLTWAQDVWTASEREAFVNWIAANPEAGDVIPATNGLRKVRWATSGRGKRGGARVIYFTRNARGQIILLLVYAKSKLDNLRPEFLRKLKEAHDV